MWPVRARPKFRIAAVTPEPQLVVIFVVGVMLWVRKTSSSWSMVLNRPPFVKLEAGRLVEFGMWPEGRPDLGSGACPEKRSAGRASRIIPSPVWVKCCISISDLTASA